MRIKCEQCGDSVSKSSIKVFKGPSSLMSALCPACAKALRKDKQADPFCVKGMKRHRLGVLRDVVDQLISEKVSRKQYGLAGRNAERWKRYNALHSSPIAIGIYESLKHKSIAELSKILLDADILLGPPVKKKLLRNRYMLEVGVGASNKPDTSPEGYLILLLLMLKHPRTKGEIEQSDRIKKLEEKLDKARRRAQALHEKRREKVKDWQKPDDEGTADRNTVTLAKGH